MPNIAQMLKWINWYPPLIGMNIRVVEKSSDWRTIRVQAKLSRRNLNAVGVHFGGTLYAMCDPWFMLMLIQALGDEYIVWDKAASIKFVRPGKGTVTATFTLADERVAEIRAQADSSEKAEPMFEVDVVDEQNQVVAHVDKLLYVRRKRPK
jgi:acyl-coenzyme A thioesterase PaaI-like protein